MGKAIQEVQNNVTSIPYKEWKVQLESSKENNPLYQLLPYFPNNENQLMSSSPQVDIHNTLTALKQLNKDDLLQCDTQKLLKLYTQNLVTKKI